MNSDLNILEKIDLYLNGKLSLEEKNKFEEEMNSNEALRDQIDLSKLVDEIIVANETKKIREQIRKDLSKPKSNLGIYIGIPIIILSLCGVYAIKNWSGNSKIDDTLVTTSPQKNYDIKDDKDTILKSIKNAEQVNGSKKSESNNTTSNSLLEPKTLEQTNIVTITKNTPTLIIPQNKIIEANTSKVEEVKPVKKSIDLCATLGKNVLYYSSPSCKGESTGEININIETVVGGQPPYSFELGDKKSNGRFDELSSGYYKLIIKDANNCSIENESKVFVDEKNCKVNKEYSFNSLYDQSWTIPYDKEKVPNSLKIFDKSGKIIYQTKVSSFEPADWQGQSNSGMNISTGIYFFTIEYADNSTDEGSIVINK